MDEGGHKITIAEIVIIEKKLGIYFVKPFKLTFI